MTDPGATPPERPEAERRAATEREHPIVVVDELETQVWAMRTGRRVARVVDHRRRELRTRIEARPGHRRWVLVSVLSGLFATGWTITALTAAVPFIRDEFATTNAAVSWVIAAPFLLRAVFVPAFGKLGDLLGRKRVWVAGLGFATAFNLLSGFAPDMGSLVATRVLAAVGGAAVMPSSLALIAEAFEPEERPRAMGWWQATVAISPLAGVITGGFLIEVFSWRWLFYSQFPLSVVALAAGVVVLRDSRSTVQQRFDHLGAALSVLGLSALMLWLNQGAEWGWTSPVLLAAGAVAAVALGAFVAVELRSEHPVIPVRYFRDLRFSAAVAMNFFGMFSYVGAFFVTSLMLRDVFAYGAAGVSLAIAPRAAALGLMGPIGGSLTGRLGGKTLAVAGTLLIVVSMFLLAAIEPASEYLPDILPGLVMAGLGLGLVAPQASATVTNAVDADDLSAAAGTLSMFISVGQSLGITVMQALVAVHAGGLVPTADDYAFSYLAAGGICVAGLVAALFVPMWPQGREGRARRAASGSPPAPTAPLPGG